MYEEMICRSEEPLLIVISGPSGVGKDSVLQRMKERGLHFKFVVTATTRTRREDEVDGVNYFFVSQEQFQRMIDEDELFEYALVYKDYKGVPKQQFQDALSSGIDVIMRLDVQGAKTVRSKSPEAILIFLSTRDEDELVRRLEARRTESPESLNVRIETARQEMDLIEEFDYYVINEDDELDKAVDAILAIITAEHHRTQPRKVSL
ncbi:MAG: guanylate kinase [Anaerolineales bacterium]|nr:guanylate kinase [Anaerolineales bacterium]